MSETPKKPLKRGRKPKEENSDDKCRFCGCTLRATGSNTSSCENLFKPSRRQESPGLILAKACESIGFPLVHRSQTLSERVCRPCGIKIRKATELYNFIKSSVSDRPEAAVEQDDDDDDGRTKRQLPTTITPERNRGVKKFHEDSTNTGQGTAESNTLNSRKSLFRQNSKGTSTTETSVENIDQTSREFPASSECNSDILTNFCNIDAIAGKRDVQLKVVILHPNGEVVVRESFDSSTKSLIKNLALKKWKPAANQAFDHPQLKQHSSEAIRRALSEEFKTLSKSDTILKGRKPDEITAFSNKTFVHEISVLCPL